jgi:hypothetical protein
MLSSGRNSASRPVLGEVVAVLFAKRANERISVLVGDLAVLVAVALVEAWLLHGIPPVVLSGLGEVI